MNWNLLTLFILVLFLQSCTEKRKINKLSSENSVDTIVSIPDTIVNKAMLFYNKQKSLWTLNDQLYSGYAVSFFKDSILKEKFGVLEGRKQNKAIQWYEDGYYKRISNYHKGKLYGDKKIWSQDTLHILLSHLKYVSGKLHGEQKKWYPTGELFKKMNLNMGKEEGIQQAFRKNGALYSNYEAKKGRVFGLKKAALCYSLEDENIKSKK